MSGARGEIYFFVDAISDGVARLLHENPDAEPFFLPAHVLPDGAREGDWLRASFEIDSDKKNRALREIDDLYADLGDDP
ncbi:MAG: DUF3006 domain-containing protein [Synergistaceae bacterium]|jgi:hypothetical protein|nr:DUF3006 domain-containing protein [Synergistaceae bacterium]